jgi:lysophospholipase L1-like esterase
MGGVSPTAPSGPIPVGSTSIYTALGASDVTGIGASSPCLALFIDCPSSTGYVFQAARQLRSQGYAVTVNNLGLPTAVISRRVQVLGRENGHDAIATLIDQLAPFLPTDTTLVTIFAGANDVNVITGALGRGTGAGNPTGFVDDQVRAFGDDYTTLIARVRSRAPGTRIVILNLPNMGALPFLASASLSQRQAAQRASVGMTTSVINALVSGGIRVIDLMCDPRLYQSSAYSEDGFHPNDAGYGVFAGEVVRAATLTSYPAPQGSCPQMTLVR